MEKRFTGLAALDQRSREIFRHVVETYIATGEPVGSRTLSRGLPLSLSPASVRNVMSDLEATGLIYAPHTSAGRMPTELGLRMFVDGLLEIGDLARDEREAIEAQVAASAAYNSSEEMLTQASNLLSGLSQCAGLVVAQKADMQIKHIEFVPLDPTKALVVMVGEDNSVENRVIELPPGLPAASLTQAANFLNAHFQGRTIDEAALRLEKEVVARQAELDALTAQVVEAGIATIAGQADDGDGQTLIVRGRANLLEDVSAIEDLERLRRLFDDLESKREVIRLLNLADEGEGVRIFIGSENNLFSLSGSSIVIAPYRDATQKIVGVLGVIGPTRLNYGRIIPMVDYTAKLVGRLLS
ncbi:MAG: heat-inducible transcriptional repressor HrcA [Hyphomicrobiales bacterium]